MKLVNRVLRLRPQLGPVSRAGSGPALVRRELSYRGRWDALTRQDVCSEPAEAARTTAPDDEARQKHVTRVLVVV